MGCPLNFVSLIVRGYVSNHYANIKNRTISLHIQALFHMMQKAPKEPFACKCLTNNSDESIFKYIE